MPIGDPRSSIFQPHRGIGAGDSISLVESLQSLNFLQLASKPHGKLPYRTLNGLEIGGCTFSRANDKVDAVGKLVLLQAKRFSYSAFPKVS
jgi:hypothetical protein